MLCTFACVDSPGPQPYSFHAAVNQLQTRHFAIGFWIAQYMFANRGRMHTSPTLATRNAVDLVSPTVEEYPPARDPGSAARGVVVGLLASVALWGALLLLIVPRLTR